MVRVPVLADLGTKMWSPERLIVDADAVVVPRGGDAVAKPGASMVGVSVYKGGYEREPGIWDGGEPVDGQPFQIHIPSTGKQYQLKTRSDGFAPVHLPVPPGTPVVVTSKLGPETQSKTAKTTRYPGGTLPALEFHFSETALPTDVVEGVFPMLAGFVIIAVVVGGVAAWTLRK